MLHKPLRMTVDGPVPRSCKPDQTNSVLLGQANREVGWR